MFVDFSIVDTHAQLRENSCAASAVELVLKLLGVLKNGEYPLQSDLANEGKGFGHFAGVINGVTFADEFVGDRATHFNDQFPLADLLARIDSELDSDRAVIASLLSGPNTYHIWVIYEKSAHGEYRAVSKQWQQTLHRDDVRQTVTAMKGTDILTYKV